MYFYPMRKLLLPFLMLTSIIFGQSFPLWDNSTVYVKVKNGISWKIPSFSGNDPALYPDARIRQMISDYGITSIQPSFKSQLGHLSQIFTIHFTGSWEQLVKGFSQMPEIAYAERKQHYQLFYTPDDIAAEQWYFNTIGGPLAWDLCKGSPTVKVAIVDDAMKISHPDLAGNIWQNPLELPNGLDDDGNGFIDDIHGYDVADNDSNPEPPNNFWLALGLFTHGTHCSGIAGGVTDNAAGVASIGFNISIIPVKSTSNSSLFPLAIENGLEGVDYAIAIGADVISMSWGGALDSTVANVIDAAYAAGIILVAAAGNDGDTTLSYPASLPGVISVGASATGDVLASFSQRNTEVDVVAPGDSIWSTLASTSPYGFQSGTSMACPMVAGLCGLMKSYNNTYNALQIETCLKNGCENIDSLNPGLSGLMGAGRINAFNALNCMVPGVGIEENLVNAGLNVFPNPAGAWATLTWAAATGVPEEVRLVNTCGQTISLNIPDNANTLSLNTAELVAGPWFLSVRVSNRWYHQTLVIAH